MQMTLSEKRLIAQIHIGKTQLGLDDETYRALLRRCTGKISCTDMTVSELHKTLHVLKQQGFKPKRAGKKLSPHSEGRRVDKLRAIWIEMGTKGLIDDNSETALLSWVQRELARQNKTGVDALDWLESHPSCNKILEQLKRWQSRITSAAMNDDFKAVSSATHAADRAGMGLDQAQVIQALLDHGVICWHALFECLGLNEQPHYTVNRQLLRPLQSVFAEAVCS